MSIASAYAELGLAPGADESEVKSAWRRMVSRWHPDRNDNAQAVARMQRINQAFERIRAAGFAVPPAAPAAGPQHPGRTAPPATADRPEPAAAAPEPGPPRTVQRKLRLSIEEAAMGCVRTLRGRFTQRCPACAGGGRHTTAGACAGCAGSGQQRPRTWFGWAGAASNCSDCQGSGESTQPCSTCGGSGRQAAPGYRVDARIPPGVRHGDWLQLAARPAKHGVAGVTLEIRVELMAHPFYTLDDDGSLRCSVPVDAFAWLAGRSVEVPTPDGVSRLSCAPGQTVLRVPGQGFPATRRGARADLVVTLVPRWPARLSTDQQILLDQLAAAGTAAATDDPVVTAWQRALQRHRHARRGAAR